MQPLQSMFAVIQRRDKSDRPWHRGLRPLLFTNNVTGSFTSPSDWCVRMKKTRPGQGCSLPPPPPPQNPSFFQTTFRRRQNGEEGLFGGGGILKHPEEGINSPKRTRIGISKVACSRRSAVVETGQGEQNWRGHWRKSEPLPNFLFFFFRSLYFSSVLHYLNAWDRLLVKLTLSRH